MNWIKISQKRRKRGVKVASTIEEEEKTKKEKKALAVVVGFLSKTFKLISDGVKASNSKKENKSDLNRYRNKKELKQKEFIQKLVKEEKSKSVDNNDIMEEEQEIASRNMVKKPNKDPLDAAENFLSFINTLGIQVTSTIKGLRRATKSQPEMSEMKIGPMEVSKRNEIKSKEMARKMALAMIFMDLVAKKTNKTGNHTVDAGNIQTSNPVEPEAANMLDQAAITSEIQQLQAILDSIAAQKQDRGESVLPAAKFNFPDQKSGEAIVLAETLVSAVQDAGTFLSGFDWSFSTKERTSLEKDLNELQNKVLKTRFDLIKNPPTKYFHDNRKFSHIMPDIGELVNAIGLITSAVAETGSLVGGQTYQYK